MEAVQTMSLSHCLVDDVTGDGRDHNRRDTQEHGEMNETLECLKIPV